MIRSTIIPKDEAHWLNLRVQDITSTEISALFGLSPYMTKFELWHQKRDKRMVDFKESDRMKWGSRLQDTIAKGIAEDQGWAIRRMGEYMRLPEQRIGASFDFAIGEDGLLEVKNVDSLIFRGQWAIDGDNIDAPAHIEMQTQHQLLVSGRKYSNIGVLIGGNRVTLIRREPSQGILGRIQEEVKAFWASIEAGIAPTPDFARDASFIASLYRFAEPGKILDADAETNAMAERYRAAAEDEKSAKGKKEALKAQILIRIKDAEKVFGTGFTISAGLIGPTHIEAYDKKGYRSFKINWKKGGKR